MAETSPRIVTVSIDLDVQGAVDTYRARIARTGGIHPNKSQAYERLVRLGLEAEAKRLDALESTPAAAE